VIPSTTHAARAVALASVGAFALGCTLDARVASVSPGLDAAAEAAGAAEAGVVVSQFQTLPAGSTLPDDATCAARVRRMAFEPRPANTTANHTVPTVVELAGLAPWNNQNAGFDDRALALQARVTGAFTGTTDEILQWAACKWGFDEDQIRAEAVQSSGWTQGLASDWTQNASSCPPDADTRQTGGGVECAETYGLFQIVWQFHQSSWPMLRDSTAFHVDFNFGLRRVCFEGWEPSLGDHAPSSRPYVANDEWGCVGAHFTGNWYDAGAKSYITAVKGQLAGRAWTRPDF
jgi:hypothetical protein